MIKLIFIFALVLLYISLIKPIFLGFPLVYVLFPFGFLTFIVDIVKNKFNIKRNFIKMFLILFSILLCFIISIVINNGGDIYYLKEVFQFNIVAFFNAYFIIKLFISSFGDDLNKFVLIFSTAVFTQLLISFVGLINPTIFDLIFSVIESTIIFENSLDSFSEFRMVVIGTPFFGSAIINCFTLLVVASYYPKSKNKKILLFLWACIAFFGMISARTTLIGILISLPLYLIYFFRYKSNIPVLVFSLALTLFLILPNVQLNNQFSNIQDFAFDFLLDFKDSKASDSTGELVQMYKVIPSSSKTWLIGDGFFKNEFGLYYKNIDIGYLRIIFANGIIGLILYLLLNFFIIRKSKIPYSSLILLALLILNLKGFTNMTYLFILFFIFETISPNKNSIIKE